MAIDTTWVRENPEEAARQIELLSEMHVDRVRHFWESRGFGGCEEFALAFDSLKTLAGSCTTEREHYIHTRAWDNGYLNGREETLTEQARAQAVADE
ncbi:hypothetical protein [Halomonas sp. GD1P12]|uniref:hypothetical protein n=1 Tax=Halomonas sp. GD1P12 TaxID=2982691 RepID=UPI0021E4343A|nr:hypothetical protein [Halomonas sp. GD1P12]UYF99366.1 hypothetical protein OCT39_14175 [Halomonas sp. GD1P12]